MIITKGAPEGLLERCADVPAAARAALDAEFAAGNRVVAVATRPAPGQSALTPADEHGSVPRAAGVPGPAQDQRPPCAGPARRLGVTVKIVTGDNPAVAAKVCPTSAYRPVGW